MVEASAGRTWISGSTLTSPRSDSATRLYFLAASRDDTRPKHESAEVARLVERLGDEPLGLTLVGDEPEPFVQTLAVLLEAGLHQARAVGWARLALSHFHRLPQGLPARFGPINRHQDRLERAVFSPT